MKISTLSVLPMVLIMFVTSSFVLLGFQFRIQIQGSETRDVLKTGVTPAEFSLLTIEASGENIKITSFQIILARGKSPVLVESVPGNSFDLTKFGEVAKAGDRIVIEVKTVGGQGKELTGNDRILTIPVK